MKNIYLIILLTITTEIGFAQIIDCNQISYNGLNFYSSKEEITKKLGLPKTTYDPNYECGFLSSYSQDGEYFTLDYGNVKFTGNEKELYVLEQVDFQNDNSIVINYGEHKLTCETELSELIKIFGKELAKHFENDKNGYIIIFHDKSDDGIRIGIKNGKLIRFEYWSPC